MFCFYDVKRLIECIHKFLLFVNRDNFSGFVVLGKASEQRSELDSIVSVSHVLTQDVYAIFFEQVNSPQNWKNALNFILKSIPALGGRDEEVFP